MAYNIDNRLPEVVYAHASPRSVGPGSLFDMEPITTQTAPRYVSDGEAARQAREALAAAGFEILGDSPATINIAGPPDLYESFFKTTLVTQEREVIPPGSARPRTTSTFIDSVSTDRPGLITTQSSAAAPFLEGVALEQPAIPMSALDTPPGVGYPHLTLDQVAEHLGAPAVRAAGFDGSGIRLTMVDTGWERHPYFVRENFEGTVVAGPESGDTARDEDGHGTCESANVFAVAPGVTFTMVKAGRTNLIAAFDTAVNQQDRPDIISISLGYQVKYQHEFTAADQVLAESIALAVGAGIVVVCAAGNGHHAFPGQHPDVISVGGVHFDDRGEAEASDYASGFTSGIYPGRVVPDVCGLVGMQPGAAYIMLPAPPGSAIDRRCAQPPGRDGDGTGPEDGWVVASGTSAAAPQVAGVCALLLHADRSLTPNGIREVLQRSARDVLKGASNPGTGGRADKGPDDATGHGLVRADDALRYL